MAQNELREEHIERLCRPSRLTPTQPATSWPPDSPFGATRLRDCPAHLHPQNRRRGTGERGGTHDSLPDYLCVRVFACLSGFAGALFATGCHWLRPLGSINAPWCGSPHIGRRLRCRTPDRLSVRASGPVFVGGSTPRREWPGRGPTGRARPGPYAAENLTSGA